jgi:hypothetical protein
MRITSHTHTLTKSFTVRTRWCFPRATQFPLLAAGAGWDIVITSLTTVANRQIIPASRHRQQTGRCEIQRNRVIESDGQRAAGIGHRAISGFEDHMLLRSFPARLTLMPADLVTP